MYEYLLVLYYYLLVLFLSFHSQFLCCTKYVPLFRSLFVITHYSEYLLLVTPLLVLTNHGNESREQITD